MGGSPEFICSDDGNDDSDDQDMSLSWGGRPLRWVPDTAVSRCYDCNVVFGWLNRKHHCRVCGRVFCSSCTAYFGKVPSLLHEHVPSSPPTWNPAAGPYLTAASYLTSVRSVFGGGGGNSQSVEPMQKRMCGNCQKKCASVHKVEDLLIVFQELGGFFAHPMFTWRKLALVNLRWRDTVRVMLTFWRRTKRCAPYSCPPTAFQTNMLRLQYRSFSGHASWLVHLACIDEGLAVKAMRGRKVLSCATLMCSKDCSLYFTVPQALQILWSCTASDLRETAIAHMLKAPTEEVMCFTSTIIALASKYTDVRTLVVKLAAQSVGFAMAFYFRSKVHHTVVCAQVLNTMDQETRGEILNTEHFLQTIRMVVRLRSELSEAQRQVQKWRLRPKPLFPGSTTKRVHDIVWDRLIVKDSSSRPVVIPCWMSDEPGAKPVLQFLLYKNEDVRRDLVVMDVIRLTSLLTQRKMLHIPIVRYDVVPMDKECGLMLMVKESKTLYSVSTSAMSLQNYIMEHAPPDATIEQVRNVFHRSVSFCCLLSILLGLGDRHQDNVMISRDGVLFHIDFSYILGQEPTGKFTTNRMKLTSQVVDAMGGKDSRHFQEFKTMCSTLYNECRKHVSHYYYSLIPLVTMGFFKLEELHAHLQNRLIMGGTKQEAAVIIEEQLDYDTRHRTIDTFMDSIHGLGKTLRFR